MLVEPSLKMHINKFCIDTYCQKILGQITLLVIYKNANLTQNQHINQIGALRNKFADQIVIFYETNAKQNSSI